MSLEIAVPQAKYLTTPAIPKFDLRIRRDLLGRRIVRQALRSLARVLLLTAVDAVAVAFVFALAAREVTGPTHPLFLTALGALLLGQASLQTYGAWTHRQSRVRVLGAALLPALVIGGLGVLDERLWLGAAGLWTLALGLPALCLLLRGGVERALLAAYDRNLGLRRVLVVGDSSRADEVARECGLAGFPGIRIVGHLSRQREGDPGALGSLEQLAETLESHNISLVAVSSGLAGAELRRLIEECFLHGVSVSVAPAELPSSVRRRPGRHVLGWPLLELPVPQLYVAQLVLKRALDLLVASLALLGILPLLVVVGALVALDSPGPILFRQNRPGLGGRPFRMFKFRTMRVDAEAALRADPALYRAFLENDCKLPAEMDPRITRLGRFLRRTSLDELPQLLNVVLGDMSLVGPRPVVGPELDYYGEWAAVVLSVKPGITGYWQVHGRSSVAYPERAQMDLHYITNWSFAMDVRLLLLTVPAVLAARGAH